MSCPTCGTRNAASAKFCAGCGTPLHPADATAVVTAVTPEDDDPTDPGGGREESPADRHMEDDLRDCPNCGAANSPRRILCGRCGVDLDSGVVVTPPLRPAPTAPTPDPQPRGSRVVGRTVLAIVTAGVIVGGGLGAMVALGVGPFAGSVDGPPPATFDPEAYSGAPRDLPRLGVSIGASTTHQPVAERAFDPPLMLDGDLTTAWNNSGQDAPSGVGERIRVEFPEPVWLTGIVFGNGDQRDDARYLGNARVKRARVVLDAGVSFTVSLLDQQGRQVVQLDVPELTTGLRIEVLESYPGDTYDELAIAELGFRGYVASVTDARLAEERARFPRAVPDQRQT